MADSKSRSNPNRAQRLNPDTIWLDRTALVKREVEAERLAMDAKTARLRALRLEKEAADRQAADTMEPAAKPPRRKRILSIKV